MKNLYEVLHTLDSWCEAYPEDMFPEPDPADLEWLHETRRGLCDRISAHMGRHMVKHMREMAEAIRVAGEFQPVERAPLDDQVVVYWQDSGCYDIGVQFDDGKWQRANDGMEAYDAPPTHWKALGLQPSTT